MNCDPTILDFFADYIEKQLGIVYEKANYYQLERRLHEITAQMEFSSVEELYEKSQNYMPQNLKLYLLDAATNNETFFFRDKNVFDCFKEKIEGMLSKNPNLYINVWSAACSFGQEPYTLSMVLKGIKDKNPGLTYDITASDISSRALEYAKAACYSQLQVQRGLPTMLLVKYFEQVKLDGDSVWRVKPEIKDRVQFKSLNLLHEWAHPRPFDFVFCRNVLIYQSVDRKRKIVEKIHQCLRDDGYLVLGAAESMLGISEDFAYDRGDKVTLYVKKPASLKASA